MTEEDQTGVQLLLKTFPYFAGINLDEWLLKPTEDTTTPDQKMRYTVAILLHILDRKTTDRAFVFPVRVYLRSAPSGMLCLCASSMYTCI